MGKAGRTACIAVPWVLTIISLICLIVIALPGLANKDMLKTTYMFKADTSQFRADPNIKLPNEFKTPETEELLKNLRISSSTNELEDWYTVGLWNYCYGSYGDKGEENIKYCSGKSASFWFNPVEVWGLEGTKGQKSIPEKLSNGLAAYEKAVRAMTAFYYIAVIAAFVAVLVGIGAIFSRWGSLVTTIVQVVSGLAIFSFASIATGVYLALYSVFNSVLKPYKIEAKFPARAMSIIWIAAAAAIIATLFWVFSICCCSGKSSKSVKVEKTPYTYERVASPYMGASANHHGHEMQPVSHGTTGGAYEPFRHQGAAGRV